MFQSNALCIITSMKTTLKKPLASYRLRFVKRIIESPRNELMDLLGLSGEPDAKNKSTLRGWGNARSCRVWWPPFRQFLEWRRGQRLIRLRKLCSILGPILTVVKVWTYSQAPGGWVWKRFSGIDTLFWSIGVRLSRPLIKILKWQKNQINSQWSNGMLKLLALQAQHQTFDLIYLIRHIANKIVKEIKNWWPASFEPNANLCEKPRSCLPARWRMHWIRKIVWHYQDCCLSYQGGNGPSDNCSLSSGFDPYLGHLNIERAIRLFDQLIVTVRITLVKICCLPKNRLPWFKKCCAFTKRTVQSEDG